MDEERGCCTDSCATAPPNWVYYMGGSICGLFGFSPRSLLDAVLEKGFSMKKMFCLLLCVLLLPLSGCAAGAEETVLVASFYPIYVLAENVLDGVTGVRLACMAAPSTGCLHDYQLLTGDMRTLAGAAALLINGAGMEGFLADITSQLPSLPVIDCSQGIDLIAEAEGHDQDGHGHGAVNAHIWLAPQNAIQMVRNMASSLQTLLPQAAEQINANAEKYIKRLETLDAELAAAISALPRKDIVTFHEAFPYFARAYGLRVVAVVALEPEEPLSPRLLAEVVEKVRAADNPPLFSEPQYENAAVRAVSQETGAPIFELDPLVTGDGALTAYEDVMRQNLRVLLEALGE